MKASISVKSEIITTPRVAQVAGIFDIQSHGLSHLSWDVCLPIEEKPWQIGLIVGSSGSGKSTIAKHFWPNNIYETPPSNKQTSILDLFPENLSIKQITGILSSVGFSSPPAWLRPYNVLSTGQQFRVTLALALASLHPLIVIDEFTSVVDRVVAKIGSAAIAKCVRTLPCKQLIAITCHDDVEPWLQPDWLYQTDENRFSWRRLQRRPPIALTLSRCSPQIWKIFAPHHYLSADLNHASTCWIARWKGHAVAFSAWLPFMTSGPPTRREHRTVTLPDYQGVGIGNAVSTEIASMWKALGYRPTSTTTHPAMISSRMKSAVWRMNRKPSFVNTEKNAPKLAHATTRLTAGFEYIGPEMDKAKAIILRG